MCLYCGDESRIRWSWAWLYVKTRDMSQIGPQNNFDVEELDELVKQNKVFEARIGAKKNHIVW